MLQKSAHGKLKLAAAFAATCGALCATHPSLAVAGDVGGGVFIRIPFAPNGAPEKPVVTLTLHGTQGSVSFDGDQLANAVANPSWKNFGLLGAKASSAFVPRVIAAPVAVSAASGNALWNGDFSDFAQKQVIRGSAASLNKITGGYFGHEAENFVRSAVVAHIAFDPKSTQADWLNVLPAKDKTDFNCVGEHPGSTPSVMLRCPWRTEPAPYSLRYTLSVFVP